MASLCQFSTFNSLGRAKVGAKVGPPTFLKSWKVEKLGKVGKLGTQKLGPKKLGPPQLLKSRH